MKSKFTAVVASAAILAGASGAFAQFAPATPTNKDELKVESKTYGTVSKALAGAAKCYQKGFGNLQKLKPDGTALCVGAFGTADLVNLTGGVGVIGKAAVSIVKLLVDGTAAGLQAPACIQSNLLALLPTLTTLVPSLLPVAFCEGSTPINNLVTTKICGSVVGGLTTSGEKTCTANGDCAVGNCEGSDYGNVVGPPAQISYFTANATAGKTELSAIGIAVKYGTSIQKCYDKAVANNFKVPGSGDATVGNCVNAAKIKAVEGINKLAAKAVGFPTCLFSDPTQITSVLDALETASVNAANAIYCQGS